jgi:predicted nucleotidyltransferase component of viral defense system
VELFAEKIRALAERCRPRDLYDVIQIQRHRDLPAEPTLVIEALQRKCGHAGIDVPTAESIKRSALRPELDQEWSNMLAHQLPHLPPVDAFGRSSTMSSCGSSAGLDALPCRSRRSKT